MGIFDLLKKKKAVKKYTPEQLQAMEAIDKILGKRLTQRYGEPDAGVPRISDINDMVGMTHMAAERNEKGGRKVEHRTVNIFDTPEGKRYYPGAAVSFDSSLARKKARIDAMQRAQHTPADSLESHIVDILKSMDSKALFPELEEK